MFVFYEDNIFNLQDSIKITKSDRYITVYYKDNEHESVIFNSIAERDKAWISICEQIKNFNKIQKTS